MSIRIMFWNIENFTVNRLSYSKDDENLLRKAHILSTIGKVQPDILVIVETSTQKHYMYSERGQVITGGGAEGVLQMLDSLRKKEKGADWMLVPPISVGDAGYKEGVAVFFKNCKMDFAGPWGVYERGKYYTKYGSEPIVKTKEPLKWVEDWADCLPKTKPVGNHPDYQQNRLAGQWQYFVDKEKSRELYFPKNVNRAPYYTVFHVHNGSGTLERIISLFSVHTSPTTAAGAIVSIAKVKEVKAGLKANEVRVIGGDFNINRRSVSNQLYSPLLDLQLQQEKSNSLTQFVWANRNDPTELRSIALANPFGDKPYYHYMLRKTHFQKRGSKMRRKLHQPVVEYELKAYDGILVAYGASPLKQPTGYAVNRVVGIPESLVDVDMEISIPSLLKQMKEEQNKQNWGLLDYDVETNKKFRIPENFGHIRGASDHLAVYADV